MVKVSIIIPCFNQGHFLFEAIESIKKLQGYPFEVIIVNDGSTDLYTNEYTAQLKNEGFIVIFQENQGLSAARNTGIALAKGKYILPLDSDNILKDPYLTRAVEVMDSNEDISVVYSDTVFFGDESGFRKVGPFNLQRLMLYNYIDACALVRKTTLDKVGGYDIKIRHGMEDWEMWLRISFAGFKFHYLEEIGYQYRVRSESMMRTTLQHHKLVNEIENHVNNKFPEYMGHFWVTENFVNRFKRSPIKILVKLFIRAYFPIRYKRLLAKNKIRNGI
jgi:glycosyltransferase involved in cell wall biosynthesis